MSEGFKKVMETIVEKMKNREGEQSKTESKRKEMHWNVSSNLRNQVKEMGQKKNRGDWRDRGQVKNWCV